MNSAELLKTCRRHLCIFAAYVATFAALVLLNQPPRGHCGMDALLFPFGVAISYSIHVFIVSVKFIMLAIARVPEWKQAAVAVGLLLSLAGLAWLGLEILQASS